VQRIKVAVLGAGGRMGREVTRSIEADPDLELVAAVDPASAGFLTESGIQISEDIGAVAQAGADVAVDFTHPDAVVENALFCLERGIHVVIGTTGIDREGLDRIENACTKANAFVAPNFSIGAIVMMHICSKYAKYFDSVEVIEMHHDHKADAPSGTAVRTAEILASARPDGWPDDSATTKELFEGARGAAVVGVRVHAVRLPGLVADQKVVFGAMGQTLTVWHRTTDRSSFMPGVLLAIKEVGKLKGLTVGLEKLLGLE